MKLYFSPGTCSLAARLIALEANLDLQYERVFTRTQTTEAERDYRTINPRGLVPALELDDGTILTEANVLLQYLADKANATQLVPAPGDPARYRALEWLSYIATELHKSFSILFSKQAPEEFKAVTRAALGTKLTWVASQLGDREGLLGAFSAPDAYLFTVLRWTQFVQIDRTQWPALQAFYLRVAERPSVKKAMELESIRP